MTSPYCPAYKYIEIKIDTWHNTVTATDTKQQKSMRNKLMLKATWVSVVLSLYGYSFHYVHNEKRLSQDTQRIIMATCNLIQAVQILDDRYK